MFAKIDVNGENAHPLYKYLKDAKPGLLGTENIKWNFTKFLIDRDGEPWRAMRRRPSRKIGSADPEAALTRGRYDERIVQRIAGGAHRADRIA